MKVVIYRDKVRKLPKEKFPVRLNPPKINPRLFDKKAKLPKRRK